MCATAHHKLLSGIGGNVLVVGPARCDPRDMFRCRGLPGLGDDFVTSDESDVNMSVDLVAPSGGSCRKSSDEGVTKAAAWCAEMPALGGLDLPDSFAWRSIILIDPLLSSRPLLGRERLDALPGGEGWLLLLGDSMACFRFHALASEPSVMRLGSRSGVHGHLPASGKSPISLVRLDINVYQHIFA